MSLYSEYYFNSAPSVVELDLIEIEHPRFDPTVFRLVRNAQNQELSTLDVFGLPKMGAIVTHEDATGPHEYEYMPMLIERTRANTDMDQSITVTLGDVGEVLPQQLELVNSFNANTVKPIVRYRSYRSDALTVPLTVVPAIFEIKRVTFSKSGCAFEAVAPYFNVARTGIIYDVKKFPTMASFFKNG